MKAKIRMNLLGIYDLILAAGAVYSGALMLTGQKAFSEYPGEWLAKLPFQSWLVPGILAVAVFGVGNAAASVLSFRKAGNGAWLASLLMGAVLLACLVCQIAVLGEWYMATLEFALCCVIQIILSLFGFSGCRKTGGAKNPGSEIRI